MAIQETQSILHWNYFLALELDVERLARFVEFTGSNFATYSIEMAHLFIAAASRNNWAPEYRAASDSVQSAIGHCSSLWDIWGRHSALFQLNRA